MNKTATAVCFAVLVIAIHSVKCSFLETSSEKLISDEELVKLNLEDIQSVKFLPIWQGITGANNDNLLDKNDEKSSKVKRQTSHHQTQLYPILPTGSPYDQQPNYNYNQQGYGYIPNNYIPLGPYGQNSQSNPWLRNYNSPYGSNTQFVQNNYTQPGYPISNGYKPSNSSYNPTGSYGQTTPPNSWQNSRQPGYSNPYGSNTQFAQNNYTQPGYPTLNGNKPSNSSYNPTGSYGQTTPPNSWQNSRQPGYNNAYGSNTQFAQNNYTQPGYPTSNGYKPSNSSPAGSYGQTTPPNSWQNPYYSSNNGQNLYNNSTRNPTSGYKPGNTYNYSSARPPYNQPGQNAQRIPNPNSYYPSQTQAYYPGQSQNNNTRPANQHPVIYDNSTKSPGPNPYNGYNASNWSGSTLNYSRPYNPQNGQNPQNPYAFPGSPGFGQNSATSYNSPNQRPPYGQNYGNPTSNNYTGHSSDPDTFNIANGYNPNIPNRPSNNFPHGNGPFNNIQNFNSPPYSSGNSDNFQYPNINSHDPTRVSPQHFNSF